MVSNLLLNLATGILCFLKKFWRYPLVIFQNFDVIFRFLFLANVYFISLNKVSMIILLFAFCNFNVANLVLSASAPVVS